MVTESTTRAASKTIASQIVTGQENLSFRVHSLGIALCSQDRVTQLLPGLRLVQVTVQCLRDARRGGQLDPGQLAVLGLHPVQECRGLALAPGDGLRAG